MISVRTDDSNSVMDLVSRVAILVPSSFYPLMGGPPCAALERREFHKVTLSNLFYLSLEVGREKVNMIFALVFPTKLSTFFFFIIRKAQSHTLTSMMGTTSALRRSNEQQFSALLYLE